MTFGDLCEFLEIGGFVPTTRCKTPCDPIPDPFEMPDDPMERELYEELRRITFVDSFPNAVYFGLRAKGERDAVIVWMVCHKGDETSYVRKFSCSRIPSIDSEHEQTEEDIGVQTFSNVVELIRDRLKEGDRPVILPAAIPILLRLF